jgi:hypothetical protein
LRKNRGILIINYVLDVSSLIKWIDKLDRQKISQCIL